MIRRDRVPEKKSFGLTAAALKWIAIILMLLNHVCYSLTYSVGVSNYFVNEASWYLTRIAFVIFAFQIAEGMHYTRNRGKYILFLFLFALISEIPYDLCFSMTAFDFQAQNVFWTLAIGAAAIAAIDKLNKKPFCSILVVLAGMALCSWMQTDYAALGFVTIVSFYYYRENKTKQLLITAVLFVILNFTQYLHMYALEGFSIREALTFEGYWYCIKVELHALAAWPLLMLYRGEKGQNINKWFFYIFYPGHLLIIYFLSSFLITV